MNTPELKLLDLPRSERRNLFVHEALHKLICDARLPHEHLWQATQRLIVAGIKAEAARHEQHKSAA